MLSFTGRERGHSFSKMASSTRAKRVFIRDARRSKPEPLNLMDYPFLGHATCAAIK